MTGSVSGARQLRVGFREKVTKHSDAAILRSYLADRPGPVGNVVATEIVLDVTLTLPRPIKAVWTATKNFNHWQNRYGYAWDAIPADEENNYVHMSNKVNDFGSKIQYLVRKVVPERLIYIDSMPTKLPGMDATWSGHNVFHFFEERGKTTMSVFMEHTFFSSSVPVDELRAVSSALVQDGTKFWREYFIPDIEALVDKA